MPNAAVGQIDISFDSEELRLALGRSLLQFGDSLTKAFASLGVTAQQAGSAFASLNASLVALADDRGARPVVPLSFETIYEFDDGIVAEPPPKPIRRAISFSGVPFE